MFNLSRQERQAVLFLSALALFGLGADFASKINSPVKSFFAPSANLGKINLNKASLEDLISSRCLPKKTAEKIIRYRAECGGALESIEELKEIKGIGDSRYQKLQELFYVE